MTKTITMDINHAVQLGMRSAKIEMKAGMGWVTVDERDHFIPEGESLEIEATVFPIVVSAVKNNQRIVFTVKQTRNSNQARESIHNRESSKLNFGLKRLATTVLRMANPRPNSSVETIGSHCP